MRKKLITEKSGQALDQAPQGSGQGPKLVSVQEVFGLCSYIQGSTFRLPRVESGGGLADPCGPLTSQDIL